MNTAHDIFISYSSIDKKTAEKVCSILEESGISCWMAPRNITPGVPFSEAIINAIKSSKVFVLIYSSNSNNSTQVIKEVDRAVHHGLSVINFRLEDIPLSMRLEYYLSDVHWLDAFTPPMEQHIRQLCDVVQMFLKPEEDKDAEIAEALRKGIIKQNVPAGTVKKPGLKKRKTIMASGILLAVVITIVSLIVFNIGGIRSARAGPIESIVILPFGNYTGIDSLDLYIEGMHSMLISKIQETTGLNVIGRVTSDVYKNTDKTIPQITKELNVDAAMEVDVMCFGEKVCFQYRLQSGGTKERQLGTGDHSESKGNLFNVYNQIIKQIADEVKQSLTPEQKAKLAESRTINPEAVDAITFQEGLNTSMNFSYDALIKAMDLLNYAIEKEPDWAPLYGSMGIVWYWFSLFGYESPDSTYPKVYENINKALELDPDNRKAHLLTAELAITQEWDWEKAEKEFKIVDSIRHNEPNLRYASLLYILQRPEEAREIVDRAFKLDPKNRFVQAYYIMAMCNEGDYKSAMSFIEDLLVTDPDNRGYNETMESVAFDCGNLSKMFEATKHLITDYQFDDEAIAEIEKIYVERGFNAAYEEIIRQMENLNEKGYSLNWTLAFYYYAINQDDKAMDYLEKSAKAHEYMADMGLGGLFSRLYDNPRFIALLKKMNLPLPKSD